MPLFQVIVLAVVQGITEFLPISSTANLYLTSWLLGWRAEALDFDIALHIGTLLAIVLYFFRDLASLGEKEFFICFSMTVMGLVTVIEWEMLFPDRRDYANLTPLPIRLRTMFGAKIAALLAFLTIFSVAINAFSPVMFPEKIV